MLWRHFWALIQKQGMIEKAVFSSKRECVVFENRTRNRPKLRTTFAWDRPTRSCVRGRQRGCDQLQGKLKSGVSFRLRNQAFKSKRNELCCFCTAKERLLFVFKSPNFDRPHVWAYISGIWWAFWRMDNHVKRNEITFSIVCSSFWYEEIAELLSLEGKSWIFRSCTHFVSGINRSTLTPDLLYLFIYFCWSTSPSNQQEAIIKGDKK